MVLRRIADENDRVGMEIECTDSGPGLDASVALKDGYSSTGTLGLGLGSVVRLADSLELGAVDDQTGTRVVARKWSRSIRDSEEALPERVNPPVLVGARSRPYPGMAVNGDAYIIRLISNHRAFVAVIDGLGHGLDAAEASAAGRAYAERNADLELPVLFEGLHKAMQRTRGGVVGAASIDFSRGTLSFLGVGNIEAVLCYEGKRTALVSLGGIVGHQMRRLRTFSYDWGVGATLLMCSDGIRSQWREKLDSGLLDAHPESIAEAILSRYARQTDDATVVGIRQIRPAQ